MHDRDGFKRVGRLVTAAGRYDFFAEEGGGLYLVRFTSAGGRRWLDERGHEGPGAALAAATADLSKRGDQITEVSDSYGNRKKVVAPGGGSGHN